MPTTYTSAARPVAVSSLGEEPRMLQRILDADAVLLPHPHQVLNEIRAGGRHARSASLPRMSSDQDASCAGLSIEGGHTKRATVFECMAVSGTYSEWVRRRHTAAELFRLPGRGQCCGVAWQESEHSRLNWLCAVPEARTCCSRQVSHIAIASGLSCRPTSTCAGSSPVARWNSVTPTAYASAAARSRLPPRPGGAGGPPGLRMRASGRSSLARSLQRPTTCQDVETQSAATNPFTGELHNVVAGRVMGETTLARNGGLQSTASSVDDKNTLQNMPCTTGLSTSLGTLYESHRATARSRNP